MIAAIDRLEDAESAGQWRDQGDDLGDKECGHELRVGGGRPGRQQHVQCSGGDGPVERGDADLGERQARGWEVDLPGPDADRAPAQRT
jgi:hypothetical protein